jgi:hypothetical protein
LSIDAGPHTNALGTLALGLGTKADHVKEAFRPEYSDCEPWYHRFHRLYNDHMTDTRFRDAFNEKRGGHLIGCEAHQLLPSVCQCQQPGTRETTLAGWFSTAVERAAADQCTGFISWNYNVQDEEHLTIRDMHGCKMLYVMYKRIKNIVRGFEARVRGITDVNLSKNREIVDAEHLFDEVGIDHIIEIEPGTRSGAILCPVNKKGVYSKPQKSAMGDESKASQRDHVPEIGGTGVSRTAKTDAGHISLWSNMIYGALDELWKYAKDVCGGAITPSELRTKLMIKLFRRKKLHSNVAVLHPYVRVCSGVHRAHGV